MNIRFIHYYCSPKYQLLLDALSLKFGCELTKNSDIKNMREFTQNARNLSHIDCIVIDVSVFEESEDSEIIDGIIALYNICSAKIIVIAIDKDMDFINLLKENSISNVIYGEDDVFDKLEDMLTSDKDTELDVPIADYEQAVIQSVKQEEKEKAVKAKPQINNIINNVVKKAPSAVQPIKNRVPIRDTLMIAVCSSKSGIGCTHHAIGLTKYLTEQGYKACYVEANSKNILADLELDGRMSIVRNTYYKYDKRIVMYPIQTSAKDIMAEKYQFIIFDYGEDSNVSEREFWTKNLQVMVVGNKMWELEKFHLGLQNGSYNNCKIIMNLAPEIYRSDIKEAYDCDILFADFSPDVFFDNNNDAMYAELVKGLFKDE